MNHKNLKTLKTKRLLKRTFKIWIKSDSIKIHPLIVVLHINPMHVWCINKTNRLLCTYTCISSVSRFLVMDQGYLCRGMMYFILLLTLDVVKGIWIFSFSLSILQRFQCTYLHIAQVMCCGKEVTMGQNFYSFTST